MYRTRLGEESHVLAALLMRIGQQEADAWAELARFLHRLRGTAGTYEIHDVAQLAGDLEKRVRQQASSADLLPQGEALVNLMRCRVVPTV